MTLSASHRSPLVQSELELPTHPRRLGEIEIRKKVLNELKMLGEVVEETSTQEVEEEQETKEESIKSENKKKKSSRQTTSEFNEDIRPGSSKSNSSRQTQASSEDKSPETKRKSGKRLKKKHRSKSRDKVISGETQNELLDEIQKEEFSSEHVGEQDSLNTSTSTSTSATEAAVRTLNDPDLTTETHVTRDTSDQNAMPPPSDQDTNCMTEEEAVFVGTLTNHIPEEEDTDYDRLSIESAHSISYIDDRRDTKSFLEQERHIATPPPQAAPPYGSPSDEDSRPEKDQNAMPPPSDQNTNCMTEEEAVFVGTLTNHIPEEEDTDYDRLSIESAHSISYIDDRRDSKSFLEQARRIATPPPPAAPPYDSPSDGESQPEKAESADYYAWHLDEHSSNIVVNPSRPHVLIRNNTKKSTDGARGSVGFLTGRHVFEIHFRGSAWGSHCSIGVCTESARMQLKGYDDLLGLDEHSWAWDIPSGELFHNGESCGQWGDHVSKTPTLIGLILDRDAGTMAIAKDGDFDNATTVFTGLDKVDRHLYPAVSTVFPGMKIKIKRHQPASEDHHQGSFHPAIAVLVPEQTVAKEPQVEHENQRAYVMSGKNDENEAEAQQNATSQDGDEEENAAESRMVGEGAGEDKVASGENKEGEIQGERTEGEMEGREEKLSNEEELEDKNEQREENKGEMAEQTEEQEQVAEDSRERRLNIVEEEEEQEEEEEEVDTLKTNVVEHKEEPVRYAVVETQENALEEEEEEEEAPVVQVQSLEGGDQYPLQVAFAWDATMKGSKVQIYPGIPNICMADPSFSRKFMGIRCRRTVDSGCHRWRVKELTVNTPNVDTSNMDPSRSLNNLIIGITNDEHRTFNYGFSLTQIGRHAWGWEPARRRYYHGATVKTFPQHDQQDAAVSQDEELNIDLRLGVDIIIDCTRKTLSFEHDGKVYDTKGFYKIFGKRFAPFIVYNGLGLAPMKIEYISGPEDSIQEVLTSIRKLKTIDWEDFACFRSLSSWLVASSTISVLEERHVGNYGWGRVSPGVTVDQVSRNVVSFSAGNRQVAISALPLSVGRHTIDLTLTNVDNLTIGFISPAASQDGLIQDPSLLGGGLHSWAWFVPGEWLVHAGLPLGKYPFMVKDYDSSTISTLRLVIALSTQGSVIGFNAISASGTTVDLGIGFFNVPPQLSLVVTGSAGQDQSQGNSVKMVYRSGPTAFTEELQSMSSKVCTIL